MRRFDQLVVFTIKGYTENVWLLTAEYFLVVDPEISTPQGLLFEVIVAALLMDKTQ